MEARSFLAGLLCGVGSASALWPTGPVQAQNVLWDGLTGIEIESVCDYCITSATDGAGNLVVISTDAVNNQQNTRVVRFELDGTIDWQDTIETSEGRGVALDPSDNILVVGSAQFNGGPLTVTKYASSGGILWQRVLMSGYDASGIGSDAQGNVIVVGTQAGRMVALKHDAAGTFQWSTPITPPSGTSFGRAIAVLPTGETVIAGTWSDSSAGSGGTLVARVNAAGDVAWQGATTQIQTVHSLALDSAQNAVVGGGNAGPGGAPPRFQVLKYSATGLLEWSRELAGLGGSAYQVAVDSDDNVVAVGTVDYPNFQSRLVTAKYDSAGGLLWTREIDTAGSPTGIGPGHAVLVTDSNDIVVAGYAGGGGPGIRVASYAPDGTLVWDLAHDPVPAESACAFDIAPAPDDSVYVSGVTAGCLIGGNLYAAKIQDSRIHGDGFED